MNCNCVHEQVCKHKEKLHEAFRGIVDVVFGPPVTSWVPFENAVQESCRFRDENVFVARETLVQKENVSVSKVDESSHVCSYPMKSFDIAGQVAKRMEND